MDKSLRNTLRLVVTECRRLLEEDLYLQLEGAFGVHADGTIEPLANLAHLDAPGRADRQAIEAAIGHEEAGGAERRAAVERFVRESAFTALNRLAALKLMEQPNRALIQPTIGAGDQSKGFKQFTLIAPEAMRAQPDGGYRLYLDMLFDDLGQTMPALFNRSLPQSLLFPTQPCLKQALGLLNQPELAHVWEQDETIGWIYQFFTPPELRDQARKASAAPRDGYELAFRNQFYTPRYVVAFLADNTLGRLWYEMRGGDTRLAEQCAYLIQPESPFHPSILPPCHPSPLSPCHKRDPRALRILDPGCGSGHFLLYCFDLLLTIYAEAYDDPDLGPALRADYPDRAGYVRAAPRLILENNLHGIDIDLRAVQIAALALWLRAQREWTALGLKMRQRPSVKRVHIACAEPMPGEYDLLGEFLRDLKPAVLGNLVRKIWEKMRVAGEAGSLLKIEQEMREAIGEARRAWTATPPAVQLTLFEPDRPQAQQLAFDFSDFKDEAFWAEAEERVLQALARYAQRAGDSLSVTRRLFAHDAVQGLAFVDLLQAPFDVVLMNPPFGAPSTGSKAYIQQAYPRTKNDLYAAFVERGLELLRPGGYLGVITSRTGFFLTSFQKWREEILLKEARLVTLADLGYGVLDTAMVETAAYVLEKRGILG